MAETGRKTLNDLRAEALGLHKSGDFDEARRAYGQYLAQRPKDATMWSNAGALLRAAGQHDLAVVAQRRAYALDPDAPAVRNNLANVLGDVGQNEEALALRRSLIADTPDDAQLAALIGKSLRSLGRAEEATAWLTEARAAHPNHAEVGIQLALAQLAARDYANGFTNFRVRWQTDELTPRRIDKPEWQGESLEGKRILILPEQGFGDGMLFARFLPVLQKFGPAEVVLLCETPVAPLYAGIDGADRLVSAMPDGTDYDVWANMIDLAALYFADESRVPAPARLAIPEDSRARAQQLTAAHGDAFKVGVVWSGSVTYRGNRFRSFSHREFHRLLGLPNLQLFSLYKGPMIEGFQDDGSSVVIVDAGSHDRHFGDCAALMEQMDLIITSDTATAHLAGSLGRPVWTLLHADPFWLWTHEGSRTPWYPSMTLFRQTEPGDWATVFKRVIRRLEETMTDRQERAAE